MTMKPQTTMHHRADAKKEKLSKSEKVWNALRKDARRAAATKKETKS
jgi:hypothetical protein